MGLLGDYMPQWLPEDQDKAAAMRQGLLQFGAAMLQGRGNFGNAFGGGLAAGAQGYGQTMADQSKQQLQGAQMKRWDLESQGMQAALDEPMNLARIMQGGGAAPAGEAPGPGKVAPLSALPTMGQQAPQQAPQAQTRQQIAEGYRAAGVRLRDAGRIREAQPYFKMADEAMPKFKEQKVATVNGKRVLVNVNDQGDTSQVDGYEPDLEKLNFQDNGGATLGLDPYTGKPVSTIANTASPATRQAAANAAADRAQRERQFGISSGQREREIGVRVGGRPMTDLQETKYRTQIAKDYQSANTILSNMDEVGASAKAVKEAKGLGGATGLQAYIPSYPDSNASQAEVKLQNLEGKITNLGKAAASMSGAVGPMAVQEWKIVRDMVAAIDPKKGEKSLREQIALVEETALGASERIRDAYSKHYSADFERYPQFEAIGKKKPSGPQPGATQNGYVFKGGNPADKNNWVKQ